MLVFRPQAGWRGTVSSGIRFCSSTSGNPVIQARSDGRSSSTSLLKEPPHKPWFPVLPARCQGKRLVLTADVTHTASISLNFAHQSCLSCASKIIREKPVPWDMTLTAGRTHCTCLQPRSQTQPNPVRNKDNLQEPGELMLLPNQA